MAGCQTPGSPEQLSQKLDWEVSRVSLSTLLQVKSLSSRSRGPFLVHSSLQGGGSKQESTRTVTNVQMTSGGLMSVWSVDTKTRPLAPGGGLRVSSPLSDRHTTSIWYSLPTGQPRKAVLITVRPWSGPQCCYGLLISMIDDFHTSLCSIPSSPWCDAHSSPSVMDSITGS
jgi:hypothetical protein